MPIVSALVGSLQTSKAVNAQVGAANTGIAGISAAQTAAQSGIGSAVQQGNKVLSDVYGTETSNLSPYLAAGQQGITSLADMLKPGGELTKQFSYSPTDLQDDPGYQFQLQQGSQAIARQAAAQGQSLGGGEKASLAQYSQGLADTTYNNTYNRALTTFQTNRQNTLAPLSTLIGAGQNASGQLQQAGATYAQPTANNLIGGAEYAGNVGLQSQGEIAQLLGQIGAAKAGGSLAQGRIWGPLAGAASGAALGGYTGAGGGGGGFGGALTGGLNSLSGGNYFGGT